MLTIGFARRLATYKRLNLLLQDVERAMRVVAGDRPIQVLIAGKAHPRDEGGKRLVQELFSSKNAPGFADRVAYLERLRPAHGRLARARLRRLDQPAAAAAGGVRHLGHEERRQRRPAAVSVLDGWWAEGYDGGNGWALSGDVDHDHGAQDARHAHELFRLLEEEVAPEFYRSSARRHPARLGRPHPPLAAHARAGVRRRAHARGLRDEGLQAGL